MYVNSWFFRKKSNILGICLKRGTKITIHEGPWYWQSRATFAGFSFFSLCFDFVTPVAKSEGWTELKGWT